MDFISIYNLKDLEKEYTENPAVAFYFSAPSCNVCRILKPKFSAMLDENFPGFRLYYVDLDKSPLIGGQMRIFSIPTILIFLGGKEFYRVSRNISIEELRKTIERPYSLLF